MRSWADRERDRERRRARLAWTTPATATLQRRCASRSRCA